MGLVLNIFLSAVPSFHELWSACMEREITPPIDKFEGILARFGITRSSNILDTCAGSGSLDIELLKRGYNLATMDGDSGMLELFKRKLEVQDIVHAPKLAKWRDLPTAFRGENFDAMICCGNSLIYAGGYWNAGGEIRHEASLNGIREVLATFRAQLKPGGVFLVDKPVDGEGPVEELVAHLCVAEKDMYDVPFSIRFDESGMRRTAQILLRHQVTGEEIGTPNVTCRLKDAEFERLLRDAGFASFERIVRGENDRFPLWIAKARC